jgi:hypothetical protein
MSDPKFFDLKYQYTMLAHHVEEFLKMLSHIEEQGVYPVVDDDFEPMMKRLEIIRKIESNKPIRYSIDLENGAYNRER